MAANIIELKVNEDTTIRLPNRGSSGLRMVFTLSDSSVVRVTRKELQPSDVDQLDIKPGDAVPAIFYIKGLKAGTTTIHFAERKPGMDAGPDIPLKDFEVHVKE
jgi:hypothetical protein